MTKEIKKEDSSNKSKDLPLKEAAKAPEIAVKPNKIDEIATKISNKA